MLLLMRYGPGFFPNVFGYRAAPSVIVELFSVEEAVLPPDCFRQLLRVRPDQGLRAREIDLTEQWTRPARQFQALLHLDGVPAIGRLELLDGGDLAVKRLGDINRPEFRSVVSPFTRPIRAVRRVIIRLGNRSRW